MPFQAIGNGINVVVVQPVSNAYDYFTGDTARKHAQEMLDQNSPDHRREGTLWLADQSYGRKAPYTTLYRQQIPGESDYTARAAYIRALNRARDRSATPLFIKSIDDDQPLVRLEAAKALANVPDQNALSGLIKHLEQDGSNDVRIACADALRNFKSVEAANALVRVLNDKDFGVAWQARISLRLLTAHDYKYDQTEWFAFLSSNKKTFG